jgi:hypothetical protein
MRSVFDPGRNTSSVRGKAPLNRHSALSRIADGRGQVMLDQDRRRHGDPGKIHHVSVVGKQQDLA